MMRQKQLFFSLLVCALSLHGLAQDTLTGNYKVLRLTGGHYIAREVVSVTDSLIVEAGTIIELMSGVTIVTNGAISMKGAPNKLIRIKGGKENWGNGLAINAASKEAMVELAYVDFSNLILPINFSNGWLRKSVGIKNCQFINNDGSTAIIQVLNPDVPIGDDQSVINVSIENSLFAGNKASLYFEDMSSKNLKISVRNNVFTANKIPGYGKYSFSGNLIYGRMDKFPDFTKTLTFDNNSLTNNFLWDVDADTIYQKANFGIYGTNDSLVINNNYWGTTKEEEIGKTIYDFAVNYTSPKLVISPTLGKPLTTNPPHIYAVYDDSLRLVGYNYDLKKGLKNLEIQTNRKINSDSIRLSFTYIADSLANIVTTQLQFNKRSTANESVSIFLQNDTLLTSKVGYIRIANNKGELGEFMPDYYIGYQSYLSELAKLKNDLKKEKLLVIKDSLLPKPKPKDPPVLTKFKRKYEIGITGAIASYFGTLSNSNILKNDFTAMAGLQFRYSLQSHVSLNLSLFKGSLTGSDLRSGDSAKVRRGMSFKTAILGVSAQLEYDFVDNGFYSTRNKIRPSIGFGINYIKFDPKGEYLGSWYRLQPLGTGGQTLPGSTEAPYKLSTLGAPISVHLKYHLTNSTIFGLSATYHLLFTDYLDDVGPTTYPNTVSLAAVNGTDGAAAAHFSNPTNRPVSSGQLRSGLAGGSDGFFMLGFSLLRRF